MKKNRIASMLLASVLLVGTCFQPVHAETVNSMKDKVNQLEEEKAKAEKEQKALNAKLDGIMSDLDDAKKKVEAKEDEIAVAADELVEAKIQENEQYEQMKVRIRYMYESGDTGMLEVLLSSEDMSDFLNKVEYVEQVSEYDRRMLVEFQNLVKEIEKKEARLQKEKKELVSLQKNLAKKQVQVETLLEQKTSEIADLKGEISSNVKKLKKLIEEAKEAERRRKEQEEANKHQSSSGGGRPGASVIVNGSGYLSNPCPAAYISSEYGPRKAPVPGASTFHQGRDYAAPSGTPIYASADGVVIQKGYQAVRGNYVVVRHPNGLVTWYQHCTSIFVGVGQKVSRGQNIATVGATGRVSGPHLHFIVQEPSGALVDPRKYL